MYVLLAAVMVLAAVPVAAVSAAEEDISFVNNFGGSGGDYINAAAAALDGGFIVVGTSDNSSLGNGDWSSTTGKGGNDATIVKYDKDGAIEWQDNFGGSGADYFYGATAALDGGFVAVGYSATGSFSGTGDWPAGSGKGGNDAIIVKYDENGTVEWQKNFGGSGNDVFREVTAALDGGFVVVGYSVSASFSGTGDWPAGSGKGGDDAIIVKYDENGIIEWQKNFGGAGSDFFYGVVAAPDGGFVAAGSSAAGSFSGTGDWPAGSGKGGDDAIIVKYDEDGIVEWQKNFGGTGGDYFYGLAAAPGGSFVAAGYSAGTSFDGTGDWPAGSGKGGNDAIIVKYDEDGVVEWQNNFGSTGADYFQDVAVATDGGIAAAGSSASTSFDGTGDWSGVTGKGGSDAIIVKYDKDGAVEWKDNFGGSGSDGFYGVAAVSGGGFAAAGYSPNASFGNGDWSGVAGKGTIDAIVVKYGTEPFVPVTDISGLPSSMAAGATIALTGTVVPSDATNTVISWSVKSAGSTGATLAGANLTASHSGTIVVTAEITDGTAPGVPFVKDFTITVTAPVTPPSDPFIPVTNIIGVPSYLTVGTSITLTGIVTPSNATNQTIKWSLKSDGGTGASLNGNTLTTNKAGVVVVTATIADGKAPGTPFVKDFSITVSSPVDSKPGSTGISIPDACIWLVAILAVIALIGIFFIILFAKRRKDEEEENP